MNEKHAGLEQNLAITFRAGRLSAEKQDQIWNTVELKTDRVRIQRKRICNFAIGVLTVLILAVVIIGPNKVLAQVRSWLIPNYRPVGQSENFVIVPVESESGHEQVGLNLLSVVSTEKELHINVNVSGFDPSNLALSGERLFEQPYLIFPDGQMVDSIGTSYGFGEGSTEFILEIMFLPLENRQVEEIRLAIPDLPLKTNPLDEAWMVSMMVDPIKVEDRLPPIDETHVSDFEPGDLKAEIVEVKNLPAKGTTIKVKVNVPEGFELINFLAFWRLYDDQGNFYPIDDVYHCENYKEKKDCPTDEAEFTIHPALPEGRSYTLQIDRVAVTSLSDANLNEVDGETKFMTFLSIDFPEAYSVGDYIKVDRWYNIEPYSFHFLGIEVLQANEDQTKFRLVMQSPDPIVAVSLCINKLVRGVECNGPARNGMIPPSPDDLIYNAVGFPGLLTGPVEFYVHFLMLEYWVDWEVGFDL